MFHQRGRNRVALEKETGLKEISGKPLDSGTSAKAKFTVIGEEMIEKQVKPGGNAGRVYLPLNWVGKRIKIIRIE